MEILDVLDQMVKQGLLGTWGIQAQTPQYQEMTETTGTQAAGALRVLKDLQGFKDCQAAQVVLGSKVSGDLQDSWDYLAIEAPKVLQVPVGPVDLRDFWDPWVHREKRDESSPVPHTPQLHRGLLDPLVLRVHLDLVGLREKSD